MKVRGANYQIAVLFPLPDSTDFSIKFRLRAYLLAMLSKEPSDSMPSDIMWKLSPLIRKRDF